MIERRWIEFRETSIQQKSFPKIIFSKPFSHSLLVTGSEEIHKSYFEIAAHNLNLHKIAMIIFNRK